MLQFTVIHMQHPITYAIYADFENVLVPVDTVTPHQALSYTEKTAKHVSLGYDCIVIGPDGNPTETIKINRGEDCVEKFLNAVVEEKKKLSDILTHITPMELTRFKKSFFEKPGCVVYAKNHWVSPEYWNTII